MLELRHLLVAAAGLSCLQLVRYAKARTDNANGPFGALLRLIAKIPVTAVPMIGAGLVVAVDSLRPPSRQDEEARELARLAKRLQVLQAIDPAGASLAMERTKLDMRLQTLGFGELPSSELEIVQAAVENLGPVDQDDDYRQLEAVKGALEAQAADGALGEEARQQLEVQRFEVEEAQELYRLLKALNGLAADMESARMQGEGGQGALGGEPQAQMQG